MQTHNQPRLTSVLVLIVGLSLSIGCKQTTGPDGVELTDDYYAMGIVYNAQADEGGLALAYVRGDWDPIEGATVKVNGVTLVPTNTPGEYAGDGIHAEVGSTVSFAVTVPGQGTKAATAVQPAAPVVSVPSEAPAGTDIPVTWQSSSSPARHLVVLGLLQPELLDPDGCDEFLSGESRNATIPGNWLPPIFSKIYVTLEAINGAGLFYPCDRGAVSTAKTGFYAAAVSAAEIEVNQVGMAR